MYMKFKDGKSKVLTLSYDDAMVQDIRLIGILDKYGIKATFNINTGRYTPEDTVREKFYGIMKLSEAKQLYIGSGHEVAIHGLTHPFLDRIKTDELLAEILDDRKNVEAQYGTLARGMAYPYGAYNDTVIDALKKCGICYSRTTRATDNFYMPSNWLALNPTCHHNSPKLMDLAKAFVEGNIRFPADLKMFYLWGHSYEFDDKDNWQVIEQFAEYVGGREDIWCATNIEIYDYVKAYEALQTSLDKSIVHNPTATDVWFWQKGNVYCIRAGETLHI